MSASLEQAIRALVEKYGYDVVIREALKAGDGEECEAQCGVGTTLKSVW